MGTPTPTLNTSSSMSTATTGRTSLNSGSIKNLVPDWKRKHRIQPPHFVRVGGVISPSKFWVSDIPMLRSQKRKASAGMYPIMGKFVFYFIFSSLKSNPKISLQDLLWPQLWISKDDLVNLTTTKHRVYILKAKSPKSKLVCWWPFDLHTDPQIGFVPKF